MQYDALVAYLTRQIIADRRNGYALCAIGQYDLADISFAAASAYRHSLGAFLLAQAGRTAFTHEECINAVVSLAHRTGNYALLGDPMIAAI